MTSQTLEVQDSKGGECQNKSSLLSIHECPLCKKKIRVTVDFNALEQLYGEVEGIIPHIVLHGEPLRAMLCNVDKHMTVRGKGHVLSIGILKDSSTYQQFTRLWTRSTIELIEDPLEERSEVQLNETEIEPRESV